MNVLRSSISETSYVKRTSRKKPQTLINLQVVLKEMKQLMFSLNVGIGGFLKPCTAALEKLELKI